MSYEQYTDAMLGESFVSLAHRTIKKLVRPKGYSQAHWRKIWKQSPMLRPIDIRLYTSSKPE